MVANRCEFGDTKNETAVTSIARWSQYRYVVTPFLWTVKCSVQLLQCSTIEKNNVFQKGGAILKIGFLNFSKTVSNFWKLSTVQCSVQLLQCSTIAKSCFQGGGGGYFKNWFSHFFSKTIPNFSNFSTVTTRYKTSTN